VVLIAERAHPDDPGFKVGLHWRKRFGIPWLRFRGHNAYLEAFIWRYKWVSEHCAGKDLLDVPCGMGWGTSLITGCSTIAGVDVSEEAIVEARHRYGKLANFHVGSMASLDFPDHSFDVIACLEGIEHVSRDVAQHFIGEAHRILRDGGTLLLSSPYCKNGKHSGNPHHVYEYQPDEIHALLRPRFDIEVSAERAVDNLTVLFLRARRIGIPPGDATAPESGPATDRTPN